MCFQQKTMNNNIHERESCFLSTENWHHAISNMNVAENIFRRMSAILILLFYVCCVPYCPPFSLAYNVLSTVPDV